MSSTKEKILETMYDLVAEVGYDKASIGKICDRVGISKPSVYYYFPSKEEIFCTLLDNMFPTLNDEKSYASITDQEEYRTALIELGYGIIDNYRDDVKRRNVLAELSIQANRIPALARRHLDSSARTMNEIEHVLQRGVEIGVFASDFDTRHHAQFFYTLLEGMSQTVVQHEDIDEKGIWRTAVLLLLGQTDA